MQEKKKKKEETKNELIPIEITEEFIRGKLYEIRGQKVMLDADLAAIYGYTTKSLNQMVKNNKNRFGGDFAFKLSREEWKDLRSKFLTSSWGGSRYTPTAFTEQGVYMLMTVLKGDLAAKQSKDLVRIFKRMKDFILENRSLLEQRDMMQIALKTSENTIEIHDLRQDLGSVERQLSDVMDQISDVVTKSDLADMMDSFVSDDDNGWLMYNTKYCSAATAYSAIYEQAQKSVYLVDNYIGLRTLVFLKNAPAGVEIKIFSDNVGRGKLNSIEYADFCKEYPDVNLTMQYSGGVFHDRFIVLDYGTKNERVFLCGASSKDAGARITSIVEDFGIKKYKPMIRKLLKNPPLNLP